MFTALMTVLVLGVTAASCVTDFRSMRIPNVHSLIILVAFAAAYAAAPAQFGRWWEPAGAFFLMFTVTFGLFWVGYLGSGDTKLGSVLALWIGLKALVVYLFYMTVLGGVLGAIALFVKKKKPFAALPPGHWLAPRPGSWFARLEEGHSAVPYGIAISISTWLTLFHTGFIHHQIDELFKIIH